MTDIVTIRGLDHSYGQIRALRGVDLSVGAGECVALLGPNGAGKTTLVSTLTGTLAPAAGTVRITGNDPDGRPRADAWVSCTSTPGSRAR